MTDTTAAMAFEWTKIRTLRSALWSLACFAAVTVVLSLIFGFHLGSSEEAENGFDAVTAGFAGMRTGMIALVVFGVLIVTSEYSSGTIGSSLAAVPRRGVLYAAKMLTGTAAALAVSFVVVLGGFFLAQVVMGAPQSVSLSDDGVPRAVFGGVLYTTLLCAFSMGIATLLRSSALTMGILVPLFFMLSTILSNLPGTGQVAQFLPDVAGGLILSREPVSDDIVLGPWSGLAVLVAWTVAAVTAGYLAIRRRDV